MPFKTRYFFLVSMDVDPAKEALFNEVYDAEHVPALLAVPGVMSVTRARGRTTEFVVGGEAVVAGRGEPGYVAIYEIESPDVLSSEAWAAAGERGRWATEVRPFTRNRHHAVYEVLGDG